MVHQYCAVSRLFQSSFSPALSLWHLRLFFVLLLCISVTATALSTVRLLNARLLSQQPFLYFSSLVCCIVGLIQCRTKQLQTKICHAQTAKRLRQATLCASVAITLSTLAALPTPTSADAVGSKADITRIDVWLLLALTLCVQVCISSGRARHLVCGVIALSHSGMVIVTRFTSASVSATTGECLLCWNSTEVRFWREIASNLVAFTITSLIGWHFSRQNALERWRCLCVALHGSVRQSSLQSAQKKLSRVSRSIVPPALTSDLEHDFSSPPCVWSSPLVIYLRNVSFLGAELVGFYTSNGTSGSTGGGLSPVVSNVGIQELERYPQPASQHVMSFTNHLIGQIKALCESHGCYAVHIRPGEILCIAGYPDVRVDHANSCVRLALAINHLLRSISNAARIQLEARIAIHTGEAYAAVLGQSMLTFDLLGADVFHLRRHLRTAAKPGRVLVSRATFDQLPEGYEGELGPTVVDPSTNRHVIHCETLYVQPRKSADASMSSNECTETRWPTLGESISTGGLAQAFARLAHQTITESGESSAHSTHSSNSVSVLRQMKEKDAWMYHSRGAGRADGDFGDVTACLKGLCEHRAIPSPSFLEISSPKISALESHLLPHPSSSLLASLCHNFPTFPSSISSLQAFPPSISATELSNSSLQRCKEGSCEDNHSTQPLTTPIKCETCLQNSGVPEVDKLCPLAEAVLWNRLFHRRSQFKALKNALTWILLLFLLLGVAGGLLITKLSFALIVYPFVITWCLILLAVFSIRQLDKFSCFPVTLRQACVVFTIFILLASLLFILTFVPFEVQQPFDNISSPWLPIIQLSTTTLLACLSLLLLMTLTPSVPPTPINSAIVAAIFSTLHITIAVIRLTHALPMLSTTNGFRGAYFWSKTLPDAIAAHGVFTLLVCLLPWQTAKLRQWTDQWVKIILEQKVDLIRRRFALEHLLDNRIPRSYMQTEPANVLPESTSYPTTLSDLFPPRENLATAVIAISIHGIGKGDDMLQHQRSPIRNAALSQSITTTATTASSSNSVSASHRSREATVIADAVRRLNRRICLLDQMACGGVSEEEQELIGVSVERVFESIGRPSLPLAKVHSVGNCVAYALIDAETTSSLSQLGAFAAFLIQFFEELEHQCLQEAGEEQRNIDEAFVCRLQIGLHVGATVSGVVDGPQFLLLHETLDCALRLANSSPPSPVDKSIVVASSDFVAHRGGDCLVGLQAIGLNSSNGGTDAFLWCSEVQQIPRLSTAMRPVLSAAIQPPIVRNRTRKIVTSSPKFGHPKSASSLVNPNSTPPPPPPPPHKRHYAVGEARYQNYNSPILSNRNRKLSSPLLPPRHSSSQTKWPQKSVSLDVNSDFDNVDRACFTMADVEIVNGYAQPTTRLLGNSVTAASPYCVTKDTEGYANHANHQSPLEMQKIVTVPVNASGTSVTSSENVFLAVEGACERVGAAQSEGVTSISSTSPSNTNHHHSNPLYTDNEYYDEEDISIGGIDGMDGSTNPEGISDSALDAGLEWLQRAPMLGDFTVSATSNGSNFPNYRRPSTPPSNPRRTLYDPPLMVGNTSVTNENDESQRRISMEPNEKASVSIDHLSTYAVPSVGCEYEFEGGTTDFSVNEDDDEDDDQDMEVEASQTSNNSHHPQSSNVPLLMDTSWITSTDGAGGGQHGEDNPDSERAVKEQKMSDSMLVETGGPLDDDFSELSSSAAAAAAVGVNDDASSSVNNLQAYTSDEDNDEEGEDAAFLPIYFPLPEHAPNHRARRLPDVAPVSLPNFDVVNRQSTNALPSANHIRKLASPPLLMDLTCPPPGANSNMVLDSDVAEYDNLENAYSSFAPPVMQLPITNNRSQRHGPQRIGGWRPRDARGHRKRGGSHLKGKTDQQFRLNAHIVDEARRICQRLHAMGWQSALSLRTQSSESSSADPSQRNLHNDSLDGKAILLLPPPPPITRVPKRGDYVNSQSLLRRLQGFDSCTVTTVTSQVDDDQLTDDGTFDSEFLGEEGAADLVNDGEDEVKDGRKGSLSILSDLWLNLGHPRSLSNDCLPLYHAPETDCNGGDDRQDGRHGDGLLNRDVVLRRAANVRKFLPPELHPFVMPGCFSSVSATTTYATRNRAHVLPLKRNGNYQSHGHHQHRQGQKRRHVLVAMRSRGMKRSSSDPLLPNSATTNLDVSLI